MHNDDGNEFLSIVQSLSFRVKSITLRQNL
jgi:hypothetical protein